MLFLIENTTLSRVNKPQYVRVGADFAHIFIAYNLANVAHVGPVSRGPRFFGKGTCQRPFQFNIFSTLHSTAWIISTFMVPNSCSSWSKTPCSLWLINQTYVCWCLFCTPFYRPPPGGYNPRKPRYGSRSQACEFSGNGTCYRAFRFNVFTILTLYCMN